MIQSLQCCILLNENFINVEKGQSRMSVIMLVVMRVTRRNRLTVVVMMWNAVVRKQQRKSGKYQGFVKSVAHWKAKIPPRSE